MYMINNLFNQARIYVRHKKKNNFNYLPGLIPFYFPLLSKLLGLEFSHDKIINFEKLHLIYGSMIVAFLSGMQWQKIINYKIKNQLILPIIPLILVAFLEIMIF